MTRPRHRPFLMNAANRRVLDGPSRWPAPAAGWTVQVLLGVVGVCFLLAGLALADRVPEKWRAWSRLKGEGVETAATVASLHQVGVKHTSYYVTYDFVARDGRALSHQSRIKGSVYAHLHPGDPLIIRYVPEEPTLSAPAPVDPWSPVTDTLLVITAGVGGLVMLVLAVRPLAFAWRFAQQGRLLKGEVAATRIRLVKGRRILVVTYRFQGPMARVVEGSARRGLGAEGEPAPGTELAIAYVDDRRHQPL